VQLASGSIETHNNEKRVVRPILKQIEAYPISLFVVMLYTDEYE
jgi:hypothetical protein